MDLLVELVSVAFWAGAFAAYVAIIRDVFQDLDEQDRAALRGWTRLSNTFRMNRAVAEAWNAHVRLFPKSRKRAVFASLMIGGPAWFLGASIWLAYHP